MSNEPGNVIIKGKEHNFQILQEIYHSITQKTESLNRLIYDRFVLGAEDFKRLHRDMKHALETYGAEAVILAINISYADGRTENVNSLEVFINHTADADCMIENIELDYEFLLIHAQSKEPKPYAITIGVRSTIGSLNRLDFEDATDVEREMFRSVVRATGRYTIKYVDHTIAISLQAHIEKWFKSLHRNDPNKYLLLIPKFSKSIGTAIRTLIFGLVPLILWIAFKEKVESVTDLYKVGLISMALIMISNQLSASFSLRARKRMKEIYPHSLINMSKADEAGAAKLRRDTGWNLMKAVSSWIIAIFLSLIATYVAGKIGI